MPKEGKVYFPMTSSRVRGTLHAVTLDCRIQKSKQQKNCAEISDLRPLRKSLSIRGPVPPFDSEPRLGNPRASVHAFKPL